MGAVQAAFEGTEGVSASWPFDLDNLGPEVGQQHRRGWPGYERSLLDDTDAFQNVCHGNPLVSKVRMYESQMELVKPSGTSPSYTELFDAW